MVTHHTVNVTSAVRIRSGTPKEYSPIESGLVGSTTISILGVAYSWWSQDRDGLILDKRFYQEYSELGCAPTWEWVESVKLVATA